MSFESIPVHLPDYQRFSESISVLELPFSSSELHGMMCGYLCAGAALAGESYLRTLTANKKNKATQDASLAIFEVYSISQHQLGNFDFGFELLLPGEHESLSERAQAFGEWCDGFTQSMNIFGINVVQFQEKESKEILRHLQEFAQLDYESLRIDEEDERALIEVTEYARLAVLRLYTDLGQGGIKTKH